LCEDDVERVDEDLEEEEATVDLAMHGKILLDLNTPLQDTQRLYSQLQQTLLQSSSSAEKPNAEREEQILCKFQQVIVTGYVDDDLTVTSSLPPGESTQCSRL
uniref:TFIIIC_sub6 domain-containing protein n=1 Tax=Hydatigena taeniaeformis TaxID=6205 RepID=A0A0R3WTU3_HYDTA